MKVGIPAPSPAGISDGISLLLGPPKTRVGTTVNLKVTGEIRQWDCQ